MSEYKLITWDIQVPDEWPVKTERLVIIKPVRKAIREHPFDQRIVITIDNVSALITRGWSMYTLERIEHEPFMSEDLTFDHPISRLFGSTAHRIAIATPNLKNILRRMNVTGEDVYNYTLVTTYRNPEGLVPQQFVQATADPYVSVEKISEAQWNIVCVDRLIKPQKDNAIWRSDVLLPMKASIVKFEHGMATKRIPVYDLPVRLTQDHPFSDWSKSRSNHFKLLTAVPVLEEIFEAKDITREEVYNYANETTYRTHKGLIPREIFVQPAHTSDSITVMMKVSDQWEMTCFNRLVPPEGSRCGQLLTYPWIACGFRTSENLT